MSRPNVAPDGTWRYGDAHDTYPVASGEVWQVGDHWFVCGDLEEDRHLEAVFSHAPQPTLMYVDPPWNSGNARSFRTKAGVDGQQGRTVDMRNLLRHVLAPAKTLRLLAFVETGRRDEGGLRNVINDMGGVPGERWDITYYRSKPAVLMAADFRPNPTPDYPDFSGVDDEHTPTVALNAYPTGCVIDTCGGRGLTARTAHHNGWASISHELSPYRMAEAIQSVASLNHNHQPTRI